MSDTSAPSHDFAMLRKAGIGYAQDASGKIWTDYNLHDPGVTMLEQTCFALTEIAYQAAHPIRDLLTGADGTLDFDAAALFGPRKVLPCDPVTTEDLIARLAHDPAIAQVRLHPGPKPGLFHAVVTPDTTAAEREAGGAAPDTAALVSSAFRAHRPLCTDLASTRVATKRRTLLHGEVRIAPGADLERIAAEIYYRAERILLGMPDPDALARAATRDDVHDDPARFLRPFGTTANASDALEAALPGFSAIDGVTDVTGLYTTWLDPEPEDGAPWFSDIVLPRRADQVTLVLRLGKDAVPLDPQRIRDAYFHASAEAISRARHHIADADWAVLSNGRHRDFTRSPVDALLPPIYRIYGQDGALESYRQPVETAIADLSDRLNRLDAFFETTTPVPNDARSRHKLIRRLDHALALQGMTLPDARQVGLLTYATRKEAADFQVTWRQEILHGITDMNGARGSGPAGRSPGGFLRLFAALTRLKPQPAESIAAAISENGPYPAARDALDPPDLPVGPIEASNPDLPYDILVLPATDTAPLPPSDLLAHMPPARRPEVPAEFFHRAADPAAFAVIPDGQRWRVLFDPGKNETPANVFGIADFDTRAEAAALVAGLRNGWRHHHSDAEVAHLVEDIRLRADDSDYTPATAHLLLTGWTARTTLPAYRAYVEFMLDRLAPAHLYIRPVWLDVHAMARAEALIEMALPRDEASNADKDAKSDLRAFLASAANAPERDPMRWS